MEMQDYFYRHISLVFDNYEDTYWEIQSYVKAHKTQPNRNLGNDLADMYHLAIDRALRDIPENSLGYRLVSELCYGIPQHIFDELADRYLPEEDEDE
jgi:hypothetical protein